MAAWNAALLLAELLLYFGVLAALFHLRRQIGFGVFATALGGMHFIETYLAAILYVETPGGIVTSPGSSVLFAGKLALLLLVYAREDARAVRQPIYGLLVGNVLGVALAFIVRRHVPAGLPGRSLDLGFMNDIGALMIWGSVLLYIDSLAIVLAFERLRRRFRGRVALSFWLSTALVLSFDQVGFYVVLRFVTGAPLDVLWGGWVAKMEAAVVYSGLAGLYLARTGAGHRPLARPSRLSRLLGDLVYRERYRAPAGPEGRDRLTSTFSRIRLETEGRPAVNLSLAGGRGTSLILIDLDGWRGLTSRLGRAGANAALAAAGRAVVARAGPEADVFRYGGDEFVVIAREGAPDGALAFAEALRAAVGEVRAGEQRLSASLGVATGPAEGSDFDTLFALADARLFECKLLRRGRATSLDEMLAAAGADAAPRRLGDDRP